MNNKKKVIVLIPAYNTEKKIFDVFKSLENLYRYYDEIIVNDDGSIDNTLKNIIQIRKDWKLEPKITILHNKKNTGYGGVQKNLFKYFLKRSGDIGVLLHGDNQYSAERIKDLTAPIQNNNADIVLASRFYKNLNYHEEMPTYKIIGNRILTMIENFVLRSNLTEFHTGLRAYSRDFIKALNIDKYSNNFVFDSEILFDAIMNNFKIAEVWVHAKYKDNYSNLNSIDYGLRILILIIKSSFKKIFRLKKK